MKVHVPDINQSFIGYVGYVQDQLGRKLYGNELKRCLSLYISGASVTKCLNEFLGECCEK